MSTAAKDMRKVLKDYLTEVESTLTELAKLEELAEVHSTVIETNRAINLEIEDSIREIGYLQSQREELFNEYHESTFSGNADKVAEVEAERDRIDSRLEELHQTAEDLPGKLLEVNGEGIAEMLSRVDNASAPFFGPRIEGSKSRLSNGSYRHTPPTGLLAELQASNDELMGEIDAAKTRITGMQEWSKYTPKPPPTPSEIRLKEALASAKQNRPNKEALLRSLDQVI